MNRTAAKLAYKPVGLVLGMAASAASAATFRLLWRRIGKAENPLDASDPNLDWLEVVLAAALHGAIYAGVRAAVDRAGAAGVGRAVGDWHPRHLTDRLSHSAANGHRVS